jgi:hypothetical protein
MRGGYLISAETVTYIELFRPVAVAFFVVWLHSEDKTSLADVTLGTLGIWISLIFIATLVLAIVCGLLVFLASAFIDPRYEPSVFWTYTSGYWRPSFSL